MIIRVIGIIAVLVLLILSSRKEQPETKSKFSFKKLLLGIVLFIVLLYGYAMLVGLISLIPVYFIHINTYTGGGDSGIWAFALVAALTISPILSLITTIKIINKKSNDKITQI